MKWFRLFFEVIPSCQTKMTFVSVVLFPLKKKMISFPKKKTDASCIYFPHLDFKTGNTTLAKSEKDSTKLRRRQKNRRNKTFFLVEKKIKINVFRSFPRQNRADVLYNIFLSKPHVVQLPATI